MCKYYIHYSIEYIFFANERLFVKRLFSVTPYKVGDEVQLTVEEDRYARYGIHKGAIGCVVEDSVVAGKVEVDFFEPEEAAAYDSTLAVKTSDLKIIK